MQLFILIQLISYWFHEICMGYQQVPSRESWVLGDVVRYGGGIQIMHCSKLTPCVFSFPQCKQKVSCGSTVQKFQPVILWNPEWQISTTFLQSYTFVFLKFSCNPLCWQEYAFLLWADEWTLWENEHPHSPCFHLPLWWRIAVMSQWTEPHLRYS